MKGKIIQILNKHNLKANPKQIENFYKIIDKEDIDDKTLENLVLMNLTIGESYFFRDKEILEKLKNILKTKKFWKILSVGCSRGEEVYTLSFIAQELDINMEITGIDINKERIKQAREGKYKNWSVRFLNKEQIEKYFEIKDGYFYVKEQYRKNVNFENLNILDLNNTDKKFDIIFLRRVLIYISNPEKIIEKIYSLLKDDGYLVIGLGEYFPDLFKYFSPLLPISSSILVKNPKKIENKQIHKKVLSEIKKQKIELNLEESIVILEKYIEKKEFDSAYKMVKQLSKKFPLAFIVWKYKAYIELELNLKNDAKKSLKRALILNNKDEEIWQLKYAIEE
ncbi:chemotaxis protein CheR [Thermosipho africanus Ob7]|jgi:chemotaxis protein methyltransferase CheR|uniref:Chemotaxis protein methyltransferase CheR n=1 Tax=Thermosipho africanus (strain TCF52B) TaxID=484019 RepID=B7ID20_THEAB|nr:CheR family methyltransferase [Thermosipho africanus]ACJ75897.1 chemotaxis protein methyltransferase CheR [Thermosipho africanus TCF52B]RDI91796.1 chemotaxis protein CheR [Thermosipho africanus Ob7]